MKAFIASANARYAKAIRVGAYLTALAVLSGTNARAQVPSVAPVGPPGMQTGLGVQGVWIDHSGRGAIEIVPCGLRWCGYLYWVKDTVTQYGKPILDANNPDSKRRNLPICGTRILSKLQPQGAAETASVWDDGSIYDPEKGEEFDVELTLLSPNKLRVLGYAGLKFLGETFIWTRAPADIPRCGPPHL